MKITLEFDSFKEVSEFCKSYTGGVDKLPSDFSHVKVPVVKRGRRTEFIEYERLLILEHWNVKSVKWIASMLGRRYEDLAYEAKKMRMRGYELPPKRRVSKQATVS